MTAQTASTVIARPLLKSTAQIGGHFVCTPARGSSATTLPLDSTAPTRLGKAAVGAGSGGQGWQLSKEEWGGEAAGWVGLMATEHARSYPLHSEASFPFFSTGLNINLFFPGGRSQTSVLPRK